MKGWGNKEKEEGGSKPTTTSQQLSSQPLQATTPQSGQGVNNAGAAGGTTAVTQAPVQTPPTVTATSTAVTPGGKPSWSTVAVGEVPKVKMVSHQSPMFQEEFPTLKSAGDDKTKESGSVGAVKKEAEEPPSNIGKDLPYGPGPSLRPQNVGSWREGGGRGVMQQQPSKTDTPSSPTSQPSSQTETQQNGPQTSGGLTSGADTITQPMPPRPGSGPGQIGPAMPMGPPPMGMHPQYRMMNPYVSILTLRSIISSASTGPKYFS